jgi:2-dehydro-3-deoxygluconokinase
VTAELVTLGETMALLASPEIGRLRDMTSLRLSIGGSESNVAIGAARLGQSAAWIGRVGNDEFGQMILATLRREGVDVTAAVTDPSAPTAIMLKERRTAEIARVSYYRKDYAGSRLRPEDLDGELIGSARVLHVTGITLGLGTTARDAAYAAVETARARGVLVSFDFNYRTALWSREEAASEFRAMSSLADLIFAGEDELAIVDRAAGTVDAARELAGENRQVVIKRGKLGAICVTRDAIHEQPAFAVRAVDSVGAGDAFVAGYLTGLLAGADITERLSQACAAGAFAVTVVGDWEGAPSRDDLALLTFDVGTTLR